MNNKYDIKDTVYISDSFAGTYRYVSHNPAKLCRWYKEKQ